MLKDFIKLIHELNLDIEKYGNYSVAVTHFLKVDETTGKEIRVELPQNEESYKNTTKIDEPIFEIAIDENDPEICFVTRYLPNDKDVPNQAMKFSEFYKTISSLPKKLKRYEVITSAWIYLEDGYIGRRDTPVVAILADEDLCRICIVEVVSNPDV